MRTTFLAFVLASFLAACDGSVSEAVPSSGSAASSGSTSSTSAGAGGGSSTSAGAGGTSSSAASSGAGGAPTFACAFTVTGAIETSVVTSNPSSVAVYGGTFVCGQAAGGIVDSVVIAFGVPHGPGSYDLLSTSDDTSYQHAQCAADGSACTDVENFGVSSASMDCVIDLTVAPVTPQVGDPIAGSFSCPALVDADDPQRTVSLAGTFSTVFRAPPE